MIIAKTSIFSKDFFKPFVPCNDPLITAVTVITTAIDIFDYLTGDKNK